MENYERQKQNNKDLLCYVFNWDESVCFGWPGWPRCAVGGGELAEGKASRPSVVTQQKMR